MTTMRIHRFILGLTAAVLLAQPTPRPRAAAAPGIPAVKNYLGLSDQQVQQLVELRREEQQLLQPIREQMREKAQALSAARQAANPDPTTVGQLTLDLQNLRKQVAAIDEAYHAKALALLESAQKEKLDELAAAARRAERGRPIVQGATLLNLLAAPEPPPADAGRVRPNAAARPGMGMGRAPRP
jgi:hypothetical protein